MPDIPVAPDLQPPLPRFPIDHGWCAHQVERLGNNFDEDVLSYLSQLDWSRAQDISHEDCRKEGREESQDESTTQKSKESQDRTVLPANCKAFQIDDKYEPKHTTPDCKCEFVHVDREELAGIIDDGGVPLISIEEHDSGGISLKVQARSVHSRYTAISHVWRDGLGSKSHNALPKCQLQQLNVCLMDMPKPKESGWGKVTPWTYADWRRQNYSRDPCPPPLFWLDTLCIPVGPKGSEGDRLRAEAMRDMALIYSSPVQVLVLDAELQMCSTENKDAIELLARIMCSSWMTRAWTLAEGVLAREVVFQFKDMAIDPLGSWSPLGKDLKLSTSIRFPKGERYRKIYKALFGCLWNELRQGWKRLVTPRTYGSASMSFPTARASPNERILPESNEYCRELPKNPPGTLIPTNNLEVYRVNQLVDAWNELAFRTTTRPDDIPIILSSLLDFKFDPLTKESPVRDFIEAMIFSFDMLPVSLLYNTGKRCNRNSAPNNGWVPVELSKSRLKASPTMKVYADGMEIAIRNKARLPAELHVMLLPDVSLQRETYQLIDPLTGRRHKLQLHGNRHEEMLLNYCMILEDPLEENGCNPIRGALFTLKEVPRLSAYEEHTCSYEAEKFRVSFVCPLEICTPEVSQITPESCLRAIQGVHRLWSARISILYDKPANFEKLARRRICASFPTGCMFFAMMIVMGITAYVWRPSGDSTKDIKSIYWGWAFNGFIFCFVFFSAFIQPPIDYYYWISSFENNRLQQGTSSAFGLRHPRSAPQGRFGRGSLEARRRLLDSSLSV